MMHLGFEHPVLVLYFCACQLSPRASQGVREDPVLWLVNRYGKLDTLELGAMGCDGMERKGMDESEAAAYGYLRVNWRMFGQLASSALCVMVIAEFRGLAWSAD